MLHLTRQWLAWVKPHEHGCCSAAAMLLTVQCRAVMQERVFLAAGIYPTSGNDFDALAAAMDRLCLTDASIGVKRENSDALGAGFRCGCGAASRAVCRVQGSRVGRTAARCAKAYAASATLQRAASIFYGAVQCCSTPTLKFVVISGCS